MQIKENYRFSDGNNIWRLLLTENDKLIIETRETESKEVFFHCCDVHSGNPIFKNLQLDEKYWIGIEAVKEDIIFFHKYAKPDMPGHKQLFAYSIDEQKILWESEEYTFLFYYKGKIYGYLEAFEGRKFYTVDAKTGELLDDLGSDAESINALREIAKSEEDYSDYHFTHKLYEEPAVKKLIAEFYPQEEVVRDVEFIELEDTILFNYHQRIADRKMKNVFKIIDKNSMKEIFQIVLNSKANNYAPDSFFIFKNHLLLITEKKELIVYDLS
jgi:hypothetical protein